MELHRTIAAARKRKGLTQEELAELTKVTARTIQRIESGDSIPRQHTLKAMATALGLSYDELMAAPSSAEAALPALAPAPHYNQEEARYFLRMLCLSCFSYLVVPFVHFLLPAYLLRRRRETNPAVVALARKIILSQIYWLIALHVVMLLTFIINYTLAGAGKTYYINYLHPMFVMYGINMMVLLAHYVRMNQLHAPTPEHAVAA